MKDQIERGQLREGAQLPSEPELVEQFKLSRYHVRQALHELELAGYIERSRGRGTFVTPVGSDKAGISVASPNSVALSFPHYSSRFAHGIVETFMRHISEQSFQCVTYSSQADGDSEYRFLQSVRRSGVAGFAMWLGHVGERSRHLIEGISQSRLPICLIDRYLTGLDVDVVTSDNEDIGYRLTRALLERGHQHVCFVGTSVPGLTTVNDRLTGFQYALNEAEIGPTGQTAMYADHQFDTVQCDEHASDSFRYLLYETMARQSRPTGFVCTNDHLARSLAEHLISLGYTIGVDVEIATVYDDYPAGAETAPMIKITQDAHEIGLQSAQLLLARIRDLDRPVQRILLKAGPLVE